MSNSFIAAGLDVLILITYFSGNLGNTIAPKHSLMTYFKKCHVSPKPDLNLGPKQQYSQFEFEISVSKSTQPPWLDLFD